MLACHFNASGKGNYGPWGAMVDVVGRWMRVGGCRIWKMEDNNGGRTGHPDEFSNPRSNKFDIFLDVRRN